MKTYREHYRQLRPFTRRDYVREAKRLYIERTAELKRQGVTLSVLDSFFNGKGLAFDAVYAAQWSALTRKRNAGLLLSYLYKVTVEQKLDITPVLAKRFLVGCCGRGLSIQVLIKAFATCGREADRKSDDWKRLEELIEMYKDPINLKLDDDIAKRENLKKLAWSDAKAHLKRYGLNPKI